MVFEKIVLENFATYRGRNEIILTPEPGKPIVLIGGENGCGKTSMLDAFQLVLFGSTAKCSNRGKLSYEDYLKRSINRKTDPEEGAVLELFLRFYIDGEPKHYRVRRAWSIKNAKVKERFGAFRLEDDGEKYDAVFSDNWIDYLEGIFPSKVAPFFLFDGEKIEQLADFENSGPLIRSAICSLLGLNHIDQLVADLLTMEKRKFKELATIDERNEIEQIENELAAAGKDLADIFAEEARLNNQIDSQKTKLNEIEVRYRQQGGELFERRGELEARYARHKQLVEEKEEGLRLIASGSAPLLLVEGLLKQMAGQVDTENKAEKSRILNEEIEERDQKLLQVLEKTSIASDAFIQVQKFLADDREKREQHANTDCYLKMTPDAQQRLNTLLSSELQEIRSTIKQKLTEFDEANSLLDTAERSLASLPGEEMIVGILSERHKAKEELAQLNFKHDAVREELRRIKHKKETINAALIKELERTAERRFEGKDQRRIVQYSAKSRETLEFFREKVIQKHLHKIETNVLDAFKKLLRKDGLVDRLEIEPESFNLKIYNRDNEDIPTERLSAGERQLLATALLWGICCAAGKPLPTIIDTPLGRLDTSHRTNLINNYFPHASEQVLLLSTNEEIVGKYHDGLKPHISHHYLLKHQEAVGGTTVVNGYFD